MESLATKIGYGTIILGSAAILTTLAWLTIEQAMKVFKLTRLVLGWYASTLRKSADPAPNPPKVK